MIKKSFIAGITVLLLLILVLAEMQLDVVYANPIPYPDTPTTELPTLTIQTPAPSSLSYADNTLELHFNVTKPQPWNSYYLDEIPLVGVAWVYLYLDGVMKQTYSATHNTLDQYTAVLANLTKQQHTVWIDVWCEIPPDFTNASVSQTLTFTIDAQAQTIAFHDDPIVTIRPGTQSTVAPSPPAPTVTPTPTPTPTVPEFSWLVIVPLLPSLFFVAVILRHRRTISQNKPNV